MRSFRDTNRHLAVLLTAASCVALSACITIDVYRYEARPLPAGLDAHAALVASLRELRGLSFRTPHRPLAPKTVV